MLQRSFCDTQRAQPTLRLHSSRFVVESCDVFVGNRTLFEPFGNSEFRQDWNPVCSLDKNPPWFLSPLNSIWTEHPTTFVGSSPSERNRVCVEALLVVWSGLSERARKVWLTSVYLWKSLWVTLIAIGFVLVFKAQLSGAKFYGVCVCVQMLQRMIILLCGIIVWRGCGGTCPYLSNCGG